MTVFGLFVALSVALTWPLAARLDTAVSDLGDPLLVAWILDWDCYALVHSPLHIFDAPVFTPAKLPLAYSENLIGVALFALPFHLAGLPPITVYNLMMLLGFTLSGYGAYVLVRMIVHSTPAAIVGGIFFAFTSFRFDHLAHLQIIWAGWLPLLLAALLLYWRKPSAGTAALLGGVFFMNGLTNIHWLLFGSVATVLTIVFLAVAGERRGARFWTTLAAALIVGGALLLPILLPYRAVSKIYGLHRSPGEALGGSANWSDWLMAGGRSVLYGNRVSDPERRNAERQLFPGLVPLLLAAAAIVMTPRRDRSSSE